MAAGWGLPLCSSGAPRHPGSAPQRGEAGQAEGGSPAQPAGRASPARPQIDAVGALLGNGADANARDGKGNTPVHYAAGYGRGAALRLLLGAGGDVGARNGEGQAPADVVRASPANPLNQEAAVMAVLDGAAEPATILQ